MTGDAHRENGDPRVLYCLSNADLLTDCDFLLEARDLLRAHNNGYITWKLLEVFEHARQTFCLSEVQRQQFEVRAHSTQSDVAARHTLCRAPSRLAALLALRTRVS